MHIGGPETGKTSDTLMYAPISTSQQSLAEMLTDDSSDYSGSDCSSDVGAPLRSHQSTGSVEVPAEDWGITRAQIKDLIQLLRADPAWCAGNDVYTLVSDFIVPLTAGKGIGYALMLNKTQPKRVNVMVSHAFGENAEEFLEAVWRATDEDEVMYICALANFQAEDGSGPSIQEQLGRDIYRSPFYKVLASIAFHGKELGGWSWRWKAYLVRVPSLLLWLVPVFFLISSSLGYLPHSLWRFYYHGQPFAHSCQLILGGGVCCIALVLHLWCPKCFRIYPGRMLVVPNRNVDIYTRLWCVFEIFLAKELRVPVDLAPTLASAGNESSERALCGNERDMQRIRKAIERSEFGYKGVDRTVKRVLHATRWHALGIWAKYTVFMTSSYVFLSAPAPTDESIDVTFVFGAMFSYAAWIAALYGIARSTRGIVHSKVCLIIVSILFTVARFIENYTSLHAAVLKRSRALGDYMYLSCSDIHGLALVYVASCVHPSPRLFQSDRLTWTILLLGLVYVACGIFVFGRCHADPGHQWQWAIRGAVLDVGPVYMVWAESVNWGIQIVHDRARPKLARALAWIALALHFGWFAWAINIGHLLLGRTEEEKCGVTYLPRKRE